MTNGNDIITYIEQNHETLMADFLKSKQIELDMISPSGLEILEKSKEFNEFAVLRFAEGY